jgi:hypothetical protein
MRGSVSFLFLFACGDPVATDDCARRICSSADARTAADSGFAPPGTDAGFIPPGTDAGFIPPGTDAGPLPPGTDAGTGCVPAWECTAWQTTDCNTSDAATRSCVDRNGCAGAAPPPTTTTLHRLDKHFFRCRVQPVLDYGCDQFGCHGTDTGRPLRVYSRVMWRMDPLIAGNECAGCMVALTTEEWCRNYDSARSLWTADPDDSELIRQPLEPGLGGLAHVGVHLFQSTTDPNYQVLRDWINGATAPATCDSGHNGTF